MCYFPRRYTLSPLPTDASYRALSCRVDARRARGGMGKSEFQEIFAQPLPGVMSSARRLSKRCDPGGRRARRCG